MIFLLAFPIFAKTKKTTLFPPKSWVIHYFYPKATGKKLFGRIFRNPQKNTRLLIIPDKTQGLHKNPISQGRIKTTRSWEKPKECQHNNIVIQDWRLCTNAHLENVAHLAKRLWTPIPSVSWESWWLFQLTVFNFCTAWKYSLTTTFNLQATKLFITTSATKRGWLPPP